SSTCSISKRAPKSEVAFSLLLLHRGRDVEIDDATLTFRGRCHQHFFDDGGQGICVAFYGAGQRIAAEGPEAHLPHLGDLTVFERHALVIDHDEHPITLHHGPFFGEVERHDGNVLQVYVLPHVELGPV